MTFEKQVIELHFRQLAQRDRRRRERELEVITDLIERFENLGGDSNDTGYDGWIPRGEQWKD